MATPHISPLLPNLLTVLPPKERSRVLSSSRLKIALTTFIALLLAGFCAIVILLVTQIFDWLTPAIRNDLALKVTRGATDVAREAEFAIIIQDEPMIRDAFERYKHDEDVYAIVVTDAAGRTLAVQGEPKLNPADLFRGPSQRPEFSAEFISAWAETQVEGTTVGRVAMVASTARLVAGESLRRRILLITALAALAGLGLSLSFVTFYLAPVLRITHKAFESLERAAREMAAKERLEKELEIGARIQTCLLPSSVEIAGLEVSAIMTPASEVGGDYYDAFPVPGGGWIGIGDVAGHGLTSGLIMLMVQSVIGALARRSPDASPSDLISSLNTILWENIRHRLKNDEHVTLSLMRYVDDGRLVFAGAHEDIIVYRAKKAKCERFETKGTWLGAMRDIEKFTKNSLIQLEAGDTVVLFTDGITEAMNQKREQFGLERLVQLITDFAHLPVKELCNLLHSSALQHAHVRDDDLTLLVMRYRG